LITLVNIIICFLAGFIYETRFSRFSPFPVNGLTTFYHYSDDLNHAELRQIGFITLLYLILLEISCSWLQILLSCLANVQ